MSLLLHFANITVPAVVMILAPSLTLAAVGAATFFFAVFNLMHDLMHGALKLPRALNEVGLLITAAILGVSGHAVRRMHLQHHAAPLSADDLEGEGARVGPWVGLLLGPRSWWRLLRANGASREAKRWIRAGWCAVLVIQLGCTFAGGRAWLVLYAAVVGQLTIQVWASWLPHAGPEWLRRFAAHFDGCGLSLPTALIHHQDHHQRPWLSTFELAQPMKLAHVYELYFLHNPMRAQADNEGNRYKPLARGK